MHSCAWETCASLGKCCWSSLAPPEQLRWDTAGRGATLPRTRSGDTATASLDQPGMSEKHQTPPVPPPVLRSAKLQVRFPTPVPPSPPARGRSSSARLCSLLGLCSVFSWIQRIPSSGMRRNFKPTSHPQSPPALSVLAVGPRVGAGLPRGAGSGDAQPILPFSPLEVKPQPG